MIATALPLDWLALHWLALHWARTERHTFWVLRDRLAAHDDRHDVARFFRSAAVAA